MTDRVEDIVDKVDTVTTSNEEPTSDNPDMVAMESISKNDIKISNFGTSNEAVNQFKLFLVAQAKNELRRIVKLTQYLDRVEDQFISVTTDLIYEYPDNMTIVSETMKALTACINRSNELISQVVSNEKLNSFVFDRNTAETNSSGLNLESRNKVREIAMSILRDLEKEENI